MDLTVGKVFFFEKHFLKKKEEKVWIIQSNPRVLFLEITALELLCLVNLSLYFTMIILPCFLKPNSVSIWITLPQVCIEVTIWQHLVSMARIHIRRRGSVQDVDVLPNLLVLLGQ